MLAFAGNSLLCRAALEPRPGGLRIDPATFTAIRIGAGALALLPVLLSGRGGTPPVRGDRAPRAAGLAGGLLLTYALAFAASYRTVPAGTGALLLFGAVQLTMLGVARLEGERLGPRRAVGALLAGGGLVLLLAPGRAGIEGTDPVGAGLMIVSGVAWGGYTLLGRGQAAPTRATAVNFLVAAPAAALALPFFELRATAAGVGLAAASGALCSGLGYALWYAALRGHTAVSASLSQLTVPVIAGLMGLAFLGEPMTLRWAGASLLVLVGVGLGLKQRRAARSYGAGGGGIR